MSITYKLQNNSLTALKLLVLSTILIFTSLLFTSTETLAQTQSFNFTATPSSGTSPLTVNFSAMNVVADVSNYYIDFGDGTDGTMDQLSCVGGCFPNPMSASHTYTSPGTYTAKILYSEPCPDDLSCQPVMNVAATITVSVTENRTNENVWGFTVSPTSGNVPLTVAATFTLGSPCSPYTLTWGDGNNSSSVSSGNDIICSTVEVPGVKRTHIYSKPGTYTIRFQQGGAPETTHTVTVRDNNQSQTREIEELRRMVEELKAQLEKMKAGQPRINCQTFSRVLARGMADRETGGDVSRLQQFLKATGDFTYPEITGFFGTVTEAAVQRWQTRNSIVSSGQPTTTGFGVVGPRTRAAMARCSE